MKKFSKIFDSFIQKKFYKATCQVELIIESDTEGEAGSLVDSDLGGLEYLSDYKIEEISEISKDEYKEKTLKESILVKKGITNESIISSFDNKFGENKPSFSQKLEFYHLLRSAGHSKESILDSLKGKL